MRATTLKQVLVFFCFALVLATVAVLAQSGGSGEDVSVQDVQITAGSGKGSSDSYGVEDRLVVVGTGPGKESSDSYSVGDGQGPTGTNHWTVY